MKESSVGVVVIGRNEGQRLLACLTSLQQFKARVYVDSGSTDGSCALAKKLGFDVVELTVPPGFTAARARNAGFKNLLDKNPQLTCIQTVDGDCELKVGWLEIALADMDREAQRAVVFGRRRERRPLRNVYHMACDDEWNAPLGEVKSCGGDALFRVAALLQVGGFNPNLIAGEEPDMCLRLRQQHWRIWSNGSEMTSHDVSIDRLPQWWRRSRRTGFAIAELTAIHGEDAEPSWRRLLSSAKAWTLLAAAACMGSIIALVWRGEITLAVAALLWALLVLQVFRLSLKQRIRLGGLGPSTGWAALMMISKLAQTAGCAQFVRSRALRAQTALIEYKR